MYSDKKYSPAKGSVDRMWPNMKIKSLSLLLVFTGIIIISGCVNAGAQPPGSKAPENLYRSIFYPYAGLLDQRHSGYQVPRFRKRILSTSMKDRVMYLLYITWEMQHSF